MKMSESEIFLLKEHAKYINESYTKNHILLWKLLQHSEYKTNKHKLKSYSQLGQDNMVYDILNAKQAGVYVDIGAHKPIKLSNSYGVESQLNWTGVLVEINPSYIQLLKNERIGTVYDKGFIFKDNKSNVNEILKLTKSVHIDYLSVDIDGQEDKVIETIDYSKFSFSIIGIENNIHVPDRLHIRKKYKDKLEENGYIYLYSISVDDIFVSKEIFNEAKEKFNKNYGYDISIIL